MKTLTLVSKGLGHPRWEEMLEMEAHDLYPRASLFPITMETTTLDEYYLETIPWLRKRMYKPVPVFLQQALEAYYVRNQYDAIISWAAQLGLPLAFLLKLTDARIPHIVLDNWISRPKKARLLKFVHSHIDRLLLWNSTQYRFAIDQLGIPEGRVRYIPWFVDQNFFRPMQRDTDMICSVGSEMRDYPTLIEALRGLDIRCHIAAGESRGEIPETVQAISQIEPKPNRITVKRLDYPELRALYARSRFVVISLRETDTDNGLTCMLESMAMGKAVICTRTPGQVDILEEGKTGLYVPPGDPDALQEAIKYLWERPELAETMGVAGRRIIESRFTLDSFVQNCRRIVQEAIAERSRSSFARPRSFAKAYGAS